jgi:hypothetical protein
MFNPIQECFDLCRPTKTLSIGSTFFVFAEDFNYSGTYMPTKFNILCAVLFGSWSTASGAFFATKPKKSP